jgi:hypothetical protein
MAVVSGAPARVLRRKEKGSERAGEMMEAERALCFEVKCAGPRAATRGGVAGMRPPRGERVLPRRQRAARAWEREGEERPAWAGPRRGAGAGARVRRRAVSGCGLKPRRRPARLVFDFFKF